MPYVAAGLLTFMMIEVGCQESLPPRVPPVPVLVAKVEAQTVTVSIVPHDLPFPYFAFDTLIYARVSVLNVTDEVIEDSANVFFRAVIRSEAAPLDSAVLVGGPGNLLWPAYVQNGRVFILPHDSVTVLVPWLDPIPPYAWTQRWTNGLTAWQSLPTRPAYDNHGNKLPYDITDTLVIEEEARVRLFNFAPALDARSGRIRVVYHLWPNADRG